MVAADGTEIAAAVVGEGIPVVLLHGLTATRRYVVMGSRKLESAGHRVVAYDARGHGRSGPAADPDAYDYDDLAVDLEAVLDAFGVKRAVLAGASMGAHTALRCALEEPDRVAGLVVITPAYDPADQDDPARLARWDALADGLREGGVEGFVSAFGLGSVPAQWRETVGTVLRQRLGHHEHLDAVADALVAVPRSRPFASLDELAAVRCPTVVVASRDEADPGHPLAIGRDYAARIPGARLETEPEGSAPLAWQGGQLSVIISALAGAAWA